MKTKLHKILILCTSTALVSGTLAIPVVSAEEVQNTDTIMANMSLYDYEQSKTTGSKYFLFGQTKGNGEHNSWNESRPTDITPGIARDKLIAGEFELSDVYFHYSGFLGWSSYYSLENNGGSAVQLEVPDVGKLFRDEDKYGGGDFKIPFEYNEETEMYEYDSQKFKLTANADSHILEVSPYADGLSSKDRKFLPIPSDDGSDNFYFGAKTVLPFIYENGGKVNGKDMVYEFTGDDDVWVYVDGNLVLDIGGIHGAVSGTINFADFTVTSNADNASDLGYDDNIADFSSWFDTTKREHEIQMFYLERGAGESNFRVAFNLIQPTNYTVKYYDGKLIDSNNSDAGLITTVSYTNRENGDLLYPGNEILRSEIHTNVNEQTAKIIASGEYYDGMVINSDLKPITDPNTVVTTVTDDESDVVYVVFMPKPKYTVTYWSCSEEDTDNPDSWTKITQTSTVGVDGQLIKVSDIDTTVVIDGKDYNGMITAKADEEGVLGTLSDGEELNIDVLVVLKNENPTPEPTKSPQIPDISSGTHKDLKNDNAYIFGRSDTEMQAEDYMHRGEVAAVLYRLLKQNDALDGFVYNESAEPVFSDIGGRWDRSALEYMAYIGAYDKAIDIIRPDQNITRGEAFKLAAMALGYTDVTDASIEEYTQIFVSEGIVEGDEGGLRLDDPIERAEFCKIYNMIIGRDEKGLTMIDGTIVTPETYGFIDIEHDWYYDIILKATSAYDDEGRISLELRGIRNELDDYAG